MKMFRNRFPYKLLDRIEIVLGLVFFGYFGYLMISSSQPDVIVLVSIAILFTLILFIKMLLVKNSNYLLSTEFPICAHRINHIIRDEISVLNEIGRQGKITKALLSSKLISVSNFAVQMLSIMYSDLLGHLVRVSIKWFPDNNITINNNKEWENVYFETLVRSEDFMEYHDGGRHKIKQSTGMTEIATHGNTEFSVLNLKKYEKKLREDKDKKKYKNTNPDWEKEYISLIMVPIRYQPELGNHDLLGVITVDSSPGNEIRKDYQILIEEYSKVFADVLYILYDKVSRCSTTLENGQEFNECK